MTAKVTNAGHLAGIKAAAIVIEDEVWQQAKTMPTKTGTHNKIPPTVKSFLRGEIAYIAAGGPGGQAAPNAAMFETPGARHPLFAEGEREDGGRGWDHWYAQPHRPFMEKGAEIAAMEACEVYADIVFATWEKETGWR